MHNNSEIAPDGEIYKQISYLHSDGCSFIHKLFTEEFLPEYAGEYVCEAYNTYGDTDTFCRLTIKGRKLQEIKYATSAISGGGIQLI